jgi:hypothetical protein
LVQGSPATAASANGHAWSRFGPDLALADSAATRQQSHLPGRAAARAALANVAAFRYVIGKSSWKSGQVEETEQ